MTAADLPSSIATLGTRRGRVSEWDEDRGWGTVVDEDGTEHPFHATAIVDGSRSIDVGATVAFHVAAGRLGRWEAWAISPF